MNRLTVGTAFRAASFREGTAEDGRRWELLTVTDEQGKNSITIFPTNTPCGINRGDSFIINAIQGVSTGHRKGNDEKWYQTVSVNAEVVPA